jgi:hypothetical protein
MKDKQDNLVAKYTKIIHPKDLGEPTSELEKNLYRLTEEMAQMLYSEITKALTYKPVDNSNTTTE